MKSLAVALTLSLTVAFAWSDEKKDIQARYNLMATGLKKKDVKGLAALHAKGFVDIDLDGKKTTSKQFDGKMTNLFKSISIDSAVIVVNRATLTGNKAITEATVTVHARQKQADGKMSPSATFKSLIRDTWIKEGGTWKLLEGRIVKRL